VASLIWTTNARKDLKEIYEYIAADSKYYAKSFVEKIKVNTKKLKSFPKIGRIVPEYNQDEIRELIYYSYRIIYKITKQNIFIVSIFHASRDLIKAKKSFDD
jgi:plasmid stabilization system protein ParE